MAKRFRSKKTGTTYQIRDARTGQTLPWATLSKKRNDAILWYMNERPDRDDVDDLYFEARDVFKKAEDESFDEALRTGRVYG
jgi:hypothetical protein